LPAPSKKQKKNQCPSIFPRTLTLRQVLNNKKTSSQQQQKTSWKKQFQKTSSKRQVCTLGYFFKKQSH
jgi:hypothetical protein